ncbi:MAG: DUF134 domain-containing protein [Candidatus Hodarchaeota archaeon]
MVPDANNNEKTPPFFGYGRGKRRGRGRGWRRGQMGRPRANPSISEFISSEWHKQEGKVFLNLRFEELEALRLVDKERMKQEEAANVMNVSRGTLWRYLDRARTKVINALLAGKEIRVEVEKEDITED